MPDNNCHYCAKVFVLFKAPKTASKYPMRPCSVVLNEMVSWIHAWILLRLMRLKPKDNLKNI
nr:unnamed protein product [Callosobruchus analis]